MKYEGHSSARNLRIAIIVSRFNHSVVDRLLQGAVECIVKNEGLEPDIFYVPGAFEIPFLAMKIAKNGNYDALIGLGCVIRGNTPHFEYVAGETARGINDVGLATGVPTIFGVLTVNTLEDALVRAGVGSGNKGYEAAQTAIEMTNLCKYLNS